MPSTSNRRNSHRSNRGRQLFGFLDQIRWSDHRRSEITFHEDDSLARHHPGLTFVPLQLYKGLWRYSGIWDLRNVIIGVTGSTVLFYILVHWIFGLRGYPLSIFIIDSLLLIFLMGGLRLARRLYYALRQVGQGKQILILGAGDAGG